MARKRGTEYAKWEVEYALGEITVEMSTEELERRGVNPFHFLLVHGDASEEKELWSRVRVPTLRIWLEKYPGTRPWMWWKFDAPEVRDDESESQYLDRLNLWEFGERESWLNSQTPEAHGTSSTATAEESEITTTTDA